MGRHYLALLVLAATSLAPIAWAQVPAAPTATTAPKPMSASELDDVSAGQSSPITFTSQTLSAVSTGNQINAGTVQSGNVNFANGAFSGFTGIGNFVVNTGNNNVLQGSLSVTVVPLP